MKRRLGKWLVLTSGLLVGCSSSSERDVVDDLSTPPKDVAVDQAAEQDIDEDGSADNNVEPDGPIPPAHWEKISAPALPQHEDHAAVRLEDGRVLISGGLRVEKDFAWVFTPQTYLYDPASDAVTEAGQMITPRSDHLATLLDDGRVLVVGGQSADDYEKSCELFDPGASAASRWSAGAPLSRVRWMHSQVKLGDGRVLVTGGMDVSDVDERSVDTAELFDPQTSTWQPLASLMSEPRRGHTSTLLAGGKVLLGGGIRKGTKTETAEYLDSLELFDPKTGAFTKLEARLSRQRYYSRAVRLQDGRVLFVGGSCNETNCGNHHDIYDPTTDAVTPIAVPGTSPERSHELVLLLDGRVLLIHGYEDPGKVFAFDPDGAIWSNLPDLPNSSAGVTATLLLDGSVFVHGGVTDSNADPAVYASEDYRLFP